MGFGNVRYILAERGIRISAEYADEFGVEAIAADDLNPYKPAIAPSKIRPEFPNRICNGYELGGFRIFAVCGIVFDNGAFAVSPYQGEKVSDNIYTFMAIEGARYVIFANIERNRLKREAAKFRDRWDEERRQREKAERRAAEAERRLAKLQKQLDRSA